MSNRLLDAFDLVERELKIIRHKNNKIEDFICKLENIREIVNELATNPNTKKQITLSLCDILSGVPKEDLSDVIEINLSTAGIKVSISEDEIISILNFFQENELPNLERLSINDISNANDILNRIFSSTETKKTLYSLSIISANSNVEKEEELSRDTIESIFNHFKDYPYLIRHEQQYGAYRTPIGIIEAPVAPLTIFMSTTGIGTYLPWFAGEYRDGKKVSIDKKIKCYYREWQDTSDEVRLYMKIQVST